MSHSASPFRFGGFGDRVLLYAWASLDCSPSIYASHIAGMTGACHCHEVSRTLLTALRPQSSRSRRISS
jgi:hypothetical protein